MCPRQELSAQRQEQDRQAQLVEALAANDALQTRLVALEEDHRQMQRCGGFRNQSQESSFSRRNHAFWVCHLTKTSTQHCQLQRCSRWCVSPPDASLN